MDKEERDFKGVWFPKEVWLDNRLSALDKIILLEIDSLSSEEKGCYASNEYLAKFCQCSISKVSTAISKLIKLEYIELVSFDGRTRILKGRLLNFKRQDIKNSKEYNNINDTNIINNIDNNNILDNKSSKILEKNIKKSFALGKSSKRMSNKEKLYHKLLDEILVKSPLYQNDSIRDLLIRWINGLYEINKLPSSISLEDSLLELNKYDESVIIKTINNSIKSNYSRFYIKNDVSSDGINRTHQLTDYEIQKQEESYKYIEEHYGNK